MVSVYRGKVLPRLYYDHPGFFWVTLGLFLTHSALAFDALRAGALRRSPGYRVALHVVGGHTLIIAVAHAVCVVLMVVGTYWADHFRVARWGFWMSCCLFNTLGAALLVAALEYHLSITGAVVVAALSISSMAAVREPEVNPLHARFGLRR